MSEQIQLFDNRMYVELPASTTKMPQDMVQRLYRQENRPQQFFYREEGELYFTFSLYDKPLKNESVASAIHGMKNVVEAAHPLSIIDQTDVLRQGRNHCGYFAFRSPSVDQERYNLMYVTAVKGRMMLGTCSCPLEDEDSISLFGQVLLSIKDR